MKNTPDYDLSTTIWIKSSYSAGGNNCLEVTTAHRTLVPVRDSKAPHGPKLFFSSAAWAAFTSSLR
ncbi:DUF397 domain-containing protein [Streptomyces monashensis]|uniref:DUF397 domain-containing protein n=1 Tax=Streptomyces monashensis TaxID=1678012 RepID=A0A1S2QCZ8_9ACTN|nr:DUF397 domain-containing protein [Streptomyces monashensis]OIK04029.1 DUF397 domain-containing protein [Streptomyces monashensis]